MSELFDRLCALAADAAQQEASARELDTSGRSTEALRHYKDAVSALSEAEQCCPNWHPDRELLSTHIGEVEARIVYLESLEGAAAMVPCERYVEPKQLTLHKFQGVRGAQVLGATAAFGAAAGLLLSGARAGLLTAVAVSSLATRDDSAGHLFRTLGSGGADAVQKYSQRAIKKLRHIDVTGMLCPIAEFTFMARSALADAKATIVSLVGADKKAAAKKSGAVDNDAPLFLGAAAVYRMDQ
eukprot:TRINITY_DN37777_c0_g1_i1.p1 TRINITY_DN37777_c0_g1~~TRINITY_DN37777_c0_g1_i1.p1  ORF type:complete len:241 (-),score=59.89 TRINITY_DN37777_c0_g1_i1:83-805(-)